MAKVTVTEAAKLAGVSRQYFHKRYIKGNEITVERDNEGKPLIDTAELLRVFGGTLKGDTEATPSDTPPDSNPLPQNDVETVLLQAEVQLLREQLRLAQEREDWLKSTVDKLASTQQRLLEHKDGKPKSWLERLFGGKDE